MSEFDTSEPDSSTFLNLSSGDKREDLELDSDGESIASGMPCLTDVSDSDESDSSSDDSDEGANRRLTSIHS
jgi:hypothetical protein